MPQAREQGPKLENKAPSNRAKASGKRTRPQAMEHGIRQENKAPSNTARPQAREQGPKQ